jgi:hypothetical protein
LPVGAGDAGRIPAAEILAPSSLPLRILPGFRASTEEAVDFPQVRTTSPESPLGRGRRSIIEPVSELSPLSPDAHQRPLLCDVHAMGCAEPLARRHWPFASELDPPAPAELALASDRQ